ncbi:MAG: MOSC domain-containing protein [Candidatus Kuenenia sp.]|nr:MOSC domain-containing protein [Candidatus Kuenenia hertensis]
MKSTTGKLIGIAIKKASREPMILVEHATVTVDEGIENDYKGSIKKRQITVLACEAWDEACAQIKVELHWTSRRANLLIEGVSLMNSTDNLLCIGDVVLKINGKTTPCWRMDEIAQGLMDSLNTDWRCGVKCSVIKGGEISVGDAVTVCSLTESSFIPGINGKCPDKTLQ